MLDFLWSSANKPPRSEDRPAQEGTAPPAEPTSRAEEITPPPACQSSVSADEVLPPPPVRLEAEAAKSSDLPTAFGLARRLGRHRGQRLVKKPAEPTSPLTAEQRLLLLDAWRRSPLAAGRWATFPWHVQTQPVCLAEEVRSPGADRAPRPAAWPPSDQRGPTCAPG